MNKTGQKNIMTHYLQNAVDVGPSLDLNNASCISIYDPEICNLFLPCLMSEFGMRFEQAPMWTCPPCFWRSRSLALWRLS